MILFSSVFVSSVLLAPVYLGMVAANDGVEESAGLAYDIDFMSMAFSEDANAQFSIELNYNVGADATNMGITFYESDCLTPYTETVDPVVAYGQITDMYTHIITVDKRQFSVANTTLVTHESGKGVSKGSLDFCVRADTYINQSNGEAISASFQKQKLTLNYDLTQNDYTVENIEVTSEEPWHINEETSIVFYEVQCDCSTTTTNYLQPSCDFTTTEPASNGEFSYLSNTNFVFDVDPVISGHIVTFAQEFNKYVALFNSTFIPNVYTELRVSLLKLTCQTEDGPPGGTRKLTDDVAANVEITGILNFTIDYPVISMDFFADSSGVVGERSIYVSHRGEMSHNYVTMESSLGGADNGTDPEAQLEIIDISTLVLTTSYGVNACPCATSIDSCDSSPPGIKQNGVAYICVYPNDTSTKISNFYMEFKQGDNVLFTPVSIGSSGPLTTSLSGISTDGERFRVFSRVITALFDTGESYFDVEGNAYLEFSTNDLRHLRNKKKRSLQNSPGQTSPGESTFKMEIGLEKTPVQENVVGSKTYGATLINALVGLLVSFVGIVIFKKMKK